MGVRRKAIGNITVLQISGELWGGDETEQFRKAIMDEAATGNTRLVFDISDCSNMNSTGLGVFAEALRNYSSRNGSIKLAGSQKKMTNLLVMTRLIGYFGHYATVEEAIASFSESPASA